MQTDEGVFCGGVNIADLIKDSLSREGNSAIARETMKLKSQREKDGAIITYKIRACVKNIPPHVAKRDSSEKAVSMRATDFYQTNQQYRKICSDLRAQVRYLESKVGKISKHISIPEERSAVQSRAISNNALGNSQSAQTQRQNYQATDSSNRPLRRTRPQADMEFDENPNKRRRQPNVFDTTEKTSSSDDINQDLDDSDNLLNDDDTDSAMIQSSDNSGIIGSDDSEIASSDSDNIIGDSDDIPKKKSKKKKAIISDGIDSIISSSDSKKPSKTKKSASTDSIDSISSGSDKKKSKRSKTTTIDSIDSISSSSSNKQKSSKQKKSTTIDSIDSFDSDSDQKSKKNKKKQSSNHEKKSTISDIDSFDEEIEKNDKHHSSSRKKKSSVIEEIESFDSPPTLKDSIKKKESSSFDSPSSKKEQSKQESKKADSFNSPIPNDSSSFSDSFDSPPMKEVKVETKESDSDVFAD